MEEKKITAGARMLHGILDKFDDVVALELGESSEAEIT